jgi:hypothetical protein
MIEESKDPAVKKILKVGLDFHGVIDTYPTFFKQLSEALVANGDEVHIVTGQSRHEAEPLITLRYGVKFTHFFSIVDYHYERNTQMRCEGGHWFMEDNLWDNTKSIYANRVGLDFHFDDKYSYVKDFPEMCTVILVRKGFEYFSDIVQAMVDKQIKERGG